MGSSLDELDPSIREAAKYLVELARQAGLAPRVTSVYRSPLKQKKLYDAYISGRSKLPAAKPGKSQHEKRLAFDVILDPYEALKELGEIWESWGGTWGGRFKDPVHFDYRPKK